MFVSSTLPAPCQYSIAFSLQAKSVSMRHFYIVTIATHSTQCTMLLTTYTPSNNHRTLCQYSVCSYMAVKITIDLPSLGISYFAPQFHYSYNLSHKSLSKTIFLFCNFEYEISFQIEFIFKVLEKSFKERGTIVIQ